MSIWLFSGINGSGKTLNAIRTVLTDPKFSIQDEDGKEVSKRPVYQFGIQDCKLPWVELDEEGVKDWKNLPSGSVIFVDECWRVFPSRQGSQTPPHWVSELAEHRKHGFDFVLISQRGIGQVDAFLRGLVERHFHLERLYGSNTVRALIWEKCCDNVNDYHQRKEAEHKTWKLDKKYFAAYKSAELHTIKRRLPWLKLSLVAALPLALGFFGWLAWSTIQGFGKSDTPGPVAELGEFVGGSAAGVLGGGGVGPVDWAARQQPRIEKMAWTAPMYDELMVPQSAPLPIGCILAVQSGRCSCGTWQGTPIDVGPELCRQIAEHGFFDHTRPRPEPETERRFGRRDGRPQVVNAEPPRGSGAHFIPLEGGGAVELGDGDYFGPARSAASGLNAGSALAGSGGGGAGGGGGGGGGGAALRSSGLLARSGGGE